MPDKLFGSSTTSHMRYPEVSMASQEIGKCLRVTNRDRPILSWAACPARQIDPGWSNSAAAWPAPAPSAAQAASTFSCATVTSSGV